MSVRSKMLCCLSQRQDGQSLLETAIAMPLLLGVSFNIINFGYMWFMVLPLSAANHSLFSHLRCNGLHPYRLHLASRRVADCKLCQGYLCNAVDRCKNDARVTCLLPALNTGNARLFANARVMRLESDNRRVSAAVVQVEGEEIRIEAKLFVLAAGALLLCGCGAPRPTTRRPSRPASPRAYASLSATGWAYASIW